MMNFRKQFSRIVLGTGLALALTAVPGTLASALSAAAPQLGGLSSLASKAGKLDINSASLSDLKSLPGIGDSYAKKIIAGRPYKQKSELVSKGILPQGIYSKIKDLIVAKLPKL